MVDPKYHNTCCVVSTHRELWRIARVITPQSKAERWGTGGVCRRHYSGASSPRKLRLQITYLAEIQYDNGCNMSSSISVSFSRLVIWPCSLIIHVLFFCSHGHHEGVATLYERVHLVRFWCTTLCKLHIMRARLPSPQNSNRSFIQNEHTCLFLLLNLLKIF